MNVLLQPTIQGEIDASIQQMQGWNTINITARAIRPIRRVQLLVNDIFCWHDHFPSVYDTMQDTSRSPMWTQNEYVYAIFRSFRDVDGFNVISDDVLSMIHVYFPDEDAMYVPTLDSLFSLVRAQDIGYTLIVEKNSCAQTITMRAFGLHVILHGDDRATTNKSSLRCMCVML